MEVFWGKVQHGDKRGRLLGYPTANINLHQEIEEGVYVSKVKVHQPNVIASKAKQPSSGDEIATSTSFPRNDGDWYPALTFIGAAKTFGKIDVKAESFLLDFSDDLYGKILSVQLLHKLRGNQKFASSEDLLEKMRQDEQRARAYFKQILE